MAFGLLESSVSLIFKGNPALRWLLGVIKQTAQGKRLRWYKRRPFDTGAVGAHLVA